MENGRVYLDKGSLYIYDSEIYIGMKYEDFEKKYSSRIERISQFTDYAGLDCKSVTLFETPIYDMECMIIKVIFKNDIAKKINIDMDANNIEVVSDKKGEFLHAEKVKKCAYILTKKVEKQYPDLKIIDNELFFLENEKYKFGNSIDRDCIACSMYLWSKK